MNKGILAGLIFLCVVLTAGVAGIYVTSDREGPEIVIPEGGAVYVEGTDTATLLEGVTAKDDRDGDVSPTLIIEKVLTDVDSTKATVIYVAKDSKNNITKVSRIVDFVQAGADYVPSTQAEGGQDAGILEDGRPVPAEPDQPADNAEGQSESEPQPETQGQINERTSAEEIASLPGSSPRFYLSEYEITIAAGSSLNTLSYVENIEDDKDSRDSLYQNIQIEGDVNTGVPGSYNLTYYVTDSDGNRSNNAVLTVNVQ